MINKGGPNREIPRHVAFIILMAIGLIMALITIRIGDKIIEGAPNSVVFGGNKQLQTELNGNSN